jgi:hypothetical protein
MKTAEEFKRRLIELGACDDALNWADGRTAAEAWEQCERGDWLLWWSQKEAADARELTLAKARCAKLVIHLMKDERSIAAVEAAENYGLGLISMEELTAASSSSAASAYAAYASAYAASAAAYAAYADADSADAAKSETLKICAEIVRENIKPKFL